MRALFLLVLLSPPPAHALEPCFADSVGSWRGPVMNGGRIEQVDAEFSLTGAGGLTASYHIADPIPLDGTLTDFTPIGPCEAVFVWHDRGGVGVVDIRFDPARGQFRGEWGRMTPTSGNVFDGDRPPPGS